MLDFSFFQKINYRWKSKNRHGVHSPFVYDFVEQILNAQRMNKERKVLDFVAGALSKKQEKLVSQIASHYCISAINLDGKLLEIGTNVLGGILWVYKDDIEQATTWCEQDVVIFLNIYSSEEKCQNWKFYCQNDYVRLSLDVFEAGILFFKRQFLVKQHFVLKY